MDTNAPQQAPGSGTAARGDPHRVLLLADEKFRGRDLAEELGNHLDRQTEVEIFVISPMIAESRLDQELGNIDPSAPKAEERLAAVIAELNESGFKAHGLAGEADPLLAIGDGLREFPADEIVVVTHTDSEAFPAEKGLWDRLESEFHPPVTQLKVTGSASGEMPGVVEINHAPAHQRTDEEIIRETRNFPPMKKRDLFGILFGFLGTIALGLIAVAIGIEDDGKMSGPAAVVLLIAIGAFLINVAHVVGLLFFESVRYTGIWDKFMARTSVLVTGVGLAVALVLWLF